MGDNILPTDVPKKMNFALFTTQINVTTPPIISIVTTPAITNPAITNPVITNPVITNPVITNPVVITTVPTKNIKGARQNMGLSSLPGETKIGDIISNEVNRLKNEKSSVSNLQQDKTRMTSFNDSYRKRYLDYIKIMIVIVIGLVCIWLLNILEKMQIIPSYINNFIVAMIISITLIICHIIYKDIQKHDLLNYDELSIKSPDLYVEPTSNPSNATIATVTTSGGSSDSSGSSIQCPTIDKSELCGNGTTYDKVSQKCVSGASMLL